MIEFLAFGERKVSDNASEQMLLANPHFWVDRAEELRAVAATMRRSAQRQQLLHLADLDEALAARARQGARPLDHPDTIPIRKISVRQP